MRRGSDGTGRTSALTRMRRRLGRLRDPLAKPAAAYLADRPYLARAGINPFLHALTRRRARAGGEGGGEGSNAGGAAGAPLPKPDTAQAERLARRLVDGAFYLANNPDL
ncbi:hypothetical protein ADL19_00005, partial [Streptomyces purpurogeneiscleroticus]